MASSNVYLQGGPCDGRTVSADRIVGGLVAYIECGGGYYVLADGVTRANGDIVFKWSGKTQPGPPGGSGGGTPHTHAGWNSIRKSVNKHLPRDLRASHRMTSAALRSLSRARRVRL